MSELRVIWEDDAVRLLGRHDRFTRSAIRDEFRRDPRNQAIELDPVAREYVTPVSNKQFGVVWCLDDERHEAVVRAVVSLARGPLELDQLRDQVSRVRQAGLQGTSPAPIVHLLTVHGVGGHDHLSNLLRTYQSFLSNLESAEAPTSFEDQIPGWRLVQFEYGATPPFLRLEPRVEPPAGSVGAVCVYEVNYSSFAGVVRRNQPLDLTSLFIGLDLAVCEARQLSGNAHSAVFAGSVPRLAGCLQDVASVLTAGTVPILGLPAVLFRRYIGTFVATFTRFFEDVATFVLDRNGEQLISLHLDRTIELIAAAMHPGDRLVVAAHSLGSVVVHNYVVRQWAAGSRRLPDTLITFGSPIGLLQWVWLYLDFYDMRFENWSSGDRYFSWSPPRNGTATRTPLRWINVVNCVDPIATAFPVGALDPSTNEEVIRGALRGGTIVHRFFGDARLTSVGAAHSQYLNDKKGFVRVLLRACGLAPGDPEDVADKRSPSQHWHTTLSVLKTLQWILFGAALAAISLYCGLVARAFHDRRALWFVILFLWPAATIGTLAFFQRLVLSGPTKHSPLASIRALKWRDSVSFPYRLRDCIMRLIGRAADVDPTAAGAGYVRGLVVKAIAFVPALIGMTLPIAGTAWLSGNWPTPSGTWQRLSTADALAALVLFMVYVSSCAGHELVRIWRRVVQTLT